MKVICLLVVVTSAVAQEEEFSPEDDYIINPHLANILSARFPLLSALLDRSVSSPQHSSFYPSYPPVPIYVPMPVPESYSWWDTFFPCKHKKNKHKTPLKKGDEENSEEQGDEAEHEDHLEHSGYPTYPPYHPLYPPYPLPPPPPYYPPTTTTTQKTTTTAKKTTTTTKAPTTTKTTKKPQPATEGYPVHYPHPPPDYHKPGYHPSYPIPYPPTTTTTTTTTTAKPTKPLWWTIIFSTPKPLTKKTDTKRKLDHPQEIVVKTDSSEVEEQKDEEPIQERPEIEYDEDYAGPTEKIEPEDPWAIPV